MTDGRKLLQIVSEGGGYHFGQAAAKICEVRVGERTDYGNEPEPARR